MKFSSIVSLIIFPPALAGGLLKEISILKFLSETGKFKNINIKKT
jgi:hypothetical protein